MGFGTLFFGYLILLDLPYQTITNVLAAAIMLLALNKLSFLNVQMKRAYYVCLAFLVFAFYEAAVDVLDLVFYVKLESVILNTLSYSSRNVLIGALSVLMLFGMRDTAREVGLKRLTKKLDIYSKITLVVYVLNLTVPPDFSLIFGGTPEVKYVNLVLLVVTTLLTLYVVLMNCVNIFSCYSHICMPEEGERADAPKKSRFGFVNKFREHEEEKAREYAQYRYDKKMKRKNKKNEK